MLCVLLTGMSAQMRREFDLKDPAAIGALIRDRRAELRMSMRQLADGTGLSLTFIHAVEHGKTTAEIGKVLEILSALGIDLKGLPR